MDTASIGEQIRKYRKLKGLTQEELAKKSGLSTMSIRRYETGERIAPQPNLIKIAEALGVHLRDFADHSIWDDFDNQYPILAKEIAASDGLKNYLESLGYTVKENPCGNSEEGATDCSYEISGNGLKSVILSSEEYQQLQSSSSDLIYSFLWKKRQK